MLLCDNIVVTNLALTISLGVIGVLIKVIILAKLGVTLHTSFKKNKAKISYGKEAIRE